MPKNSFQRSRACTSAATAGRTRARFEPASSPARPADDRACSGYDGRSSVKVAWRERSLKTLSASERSSLTGPRPCKISSTMQRWKRNSPSSATMTASERVDAGAGGDDAHQAFAGGESASSAGRRPRAPRPRDSRRGRRRRRGSSPPPGSATTLDVEAGDQAGQRADEVCDLAAALRGGAVVHKDAHRLGEFLDQIRLPAKALIFRAEHGALEAVDQLGVGEGAARRRRESEEKRR